MIFDFETHSGRLELVDTAHLLLANVVSVAMPQVSRDMNPTIQADGSQVVSSILGQPQ
jgi:hypothetical protein